MDTKTIDTYNKLAKEYDLETTDFWKRFPATIISKFVENVGHGKVLDVGSGPGRDGVILKEAGCSVVCLDASESMVEMCRQKGLEAVVGDFMKLPFAGESFDGAWAYTSLLHIPKASMPAALAEIYRILKPGGVFGLGLIEGNEEKYNISSGVEMPRLFAYYQKDEIEEILREAGFAQIYFEEFKPKSRNYLNFILKKV